MGWSPDGKKLVFASNRRGNVDVCIAEIPVDWFADW
ncbi:MAG: PD40 domain-containing protein [Candidatus Omnitrophica bacterium]|nr:PD40 domain-containing protein [Candidatus Omnitrophota bacterium]